MAIYIVKPWYKKSSGADTAIYGAEWTIASSPAWTRTDDAVGMSDPNPYYAGMSGSPSSPFDSISPWKDMRIVEDSAAGTLVEIPKFYYKWTRTLAAMKLQISMTQHDGFLCSPAHADRGDGVGERDYVYIGRYHCDESYKKSIGAGYDPAVNLTRTEFRTAIHNLGSNIWQNDFAMWWTVRMLYLVEFAHWNSQLKIGYGSGSGSMRGNGGYTDSMPYHTGTTQASRTTYGLGTQYRCIEGLWDNVCDWVDGIYFAGVNSKNIYCIKNPANFSDTSNGTYIGDRDTSIGYIRDWTSIPSQSGFEYALYPKNGDGAVGDGTTYVCDHLYYTSSSAVFYTGGYYSQHLSRGLFYSMGNRIATYTSGFIGSRLMVLPSSRLS